YRVYAIYLKFNEYPLSLQIAIFLDHSQGVHLRESCQEILNNMKLSEGYLNIARDIEVMELKSLEVIYKENCLQKFKLPEPVFAIGGVLQIEFSGRVQQQDVDELYYV
ncbi:hypothetical protein MKX03_010707, partial [Papaver bracteatum]